MKKLILALMTLALFTVTPAVADDPPPQCYPCPDAK
jgi:hypothetical protein